MSRILRRPMFRGGLANNGGIMSYAQPRKGYAGEEGSFVQNSEDSTMNEEESGYTSNEELKINPQTIKTLSNNLQKQNNAPTQTGAKKSYSDILMEDYLGNRSDPTSKFLINFGLNYMSARPRGGKFGAITTAADAAKKPTEQLFADQDTDTAMEIKLLSAFGKEKDTDLTRMIKAYARSKNISEEAAEEIISKQKFESPTGFLKDYSDTALIRKFGEDWGKSSRVDNATQRNNYGKFRLKYEKGQIDEKITGLFPDKGNEVMDLDTVAKRKDNSNIYDITDKQSEKDYEVGKVYVNVSPSGRGFYIAKQDGSKRILFKIGEY